MPHQCLKCGNVFPDGSQELLRGCSKCNGKRFFYTNKPVSKEEREKLTEQANKDFSSLIQNILTKDIQKKYEIGEEWTIISKEDIIKAKEEIKKEKFTIKSIGDLEKDFEKEELKPKFIGEKKEKIVKEISKEEIKKEKLVKEVPRVETKKEEVKPKTIEEKMERKAIKVPVKRGEEFLIPDVITKLEDGVYEIDLKTLMENVSIVMQKDGSYKVHFTKIIG